MKMAKTVSVILAAAILSALLAACDRTSDSDGGEKSDRDKDRVTQSGEVGQTEKDGDSDGSGQTTVPVTDNLSPSAEKEIDSVISKAEKLAATNDFEGALSVIQSGLATYPDSQALQAKRDEYTAAKNAKIKKDALAKADYSALQGDYLDALSTVEQAISAIGEDEELSAKAKEYENAYATDISAQVDAYLAENKINSAKTLLLEAAKALPNNEIIKARQQEVNKYKTVPLHKLNPINDGFTWNEGTPGDPFGNTYSEAQNFCILHASGLNGHYRETTYSTEYKTSKDYDRLSFVISPYSDFGETGQSYVQVYVNGVLRYTSPLIVQKSQPFSIPSIDISDAEYIKITVHVGGYGCLMLSEVILDSAPNYESDLDDSITSLSALNTFNGEFPWENEYPTDTLKNDYTMAVNYAILHASGLSDRHYRETTCFAEYYIAKKYRSISLNIAPAADFGESGSAVVKVYVDERLVYTSKTISQKTAKFGTGEIDLTGADYVKIVVEVQEYSCTMISDVLLRNAQ